MMMCAESARGTACPRAGLTAVAGAGAGAQCCNAHDICYHTCKTDKQQKKGQEICDKEFEKCMDARCRALSGQELQGCKGEADMMSSGVRMFGCDCLSVCARERVCGCVRGVRARAALLYIFVCGPSVKRNLCASLLPKTLNPEP